MILQSTCGQFVVTDLGRGQIAMLSVGERAGERLDLLRRIERQRLTLGFTTAIRELRRIERQP